MQAQNAFLKLMGVYQYAYLKQKFYRNPIL